MFSVMELRLIRYSVQKTMDNLLKRKAILDPESEDAIEITNDLMGYQNILDTINDEDNV